MVDGSEDTYGRARLNTARLIRFKKCTILIDAAFLFSRLIYQIAFSSQIRFLSAILPMRNPYSEPAIRLFSRRGLLNHLFTLNLTGATHQELPARATSLRFLLNKIWMRFSMMRAIHPLSCGMVMGGDLSQWLPQ
ncbi:hypothetical protein [Paraburkholderia caledonica]|uniref:hypothetical protein n=1 Tax=Paraburkholderia caledonica TaxID=134536 RepID=UPI0011785063|nr:hypothetical protein [Paraburkholderia caledonica]